MFNNEGIISVHIIATKLFDDELRVLVCICCTNYTSLNLMKYILKGLFKLSVILSFRFYLPIESYLFQDIVLLLLLQRFHLPELFVISLLPYMLECLWKE